MSHVFVLRQTLGLDEAALSFDCAIGRNAGLYAVRLRGVVWDTRYVPRAQIDRDWSLVSLLLRGRVSLEPGGQVLEPGDAIVIPERVLIPVSTETTSIRAANDATEAVALRVRTSTLATVGDLAPRKLGPDLTAELVRFADLMREPKDVIGLETLLASALAAGVHEGMLSSALLEDLAPSEPIGPDLKRAGESVYPLLGDLSESPMLVDLVSRAQVSSRQLLRDILKLQSELEFPDRGWRELLARWRLTMAVLLLSADGMTPARVVSEVGYGSATAMGRAFRDAGLPSPRELRALIRGEKSAG